MKRLLNFLIFLIFAQLAANAQIYVKEGGIGDGSSWQSAAGNLRDVLFSASSGSEVWVATGTYYPTQCEPCSLNDRNISFFIPSGVAIYGGFAGHETQREQRDWVNNPTVLSGDIDQDNSLSNNSYSVIFTVNVNEQTTLDGLQIIMGNANGSNPSLEERETSGGAWFNAAVDQNISNPIIRNCTFFRNFSKGFGGAVYNLGSFFAESSPMYMNCVFDRNKAVFDGGALYNNGSFGGVSEPVISGCEFRDNVAGTTDLGSGGAIFNNGIEGQANPVIWNTKFTRNAASLEGGAIYNHGKEGNSSPELTNCVFYQNSADLGGAIYTLGAEGRALPRVTNCTFYDNFAENGAAIFNNGSNGGNANTFVTNSIFWGNQAAVGKTFFNILAKPQIHFSLVEEKDCSALNKTLDNLSDVICGSEVLYAVDPKFVRASNGDLQLNYNSPVINIGDNSAISNMMEDASANSRIHLGRVDLGAYEYDGPLPTQMDTLSVQNVEGTILISWKTLNEYQNEGFQVQRSTDDINFEVLDLIKSKGDATTAQTYAYEDPLPEVGFRNYYRLQRLDKDGCFEYSESKSVFIEVVETGASLSPNPAREGTILEITLEKDSEVNVQVVTPYGQVISNPVNGLKNRGKLLVPINIESGSTGIYYVHVQINSRKYGYPLVVLGD